MAVANSRTRSQARPVVVNSITASGVTVSSSVSIGASAASPGVPLAVAPGDATALANPAASAEARRRGRLGAYIALTKPRIIELLLATTLPTLFLAAGGFPPLWISVATLVGGTLAAGGANALNCYLDRDIDAVMKRTGHRPLVKGEIGANEALAFGLVISTISVVWLAVLINPLSGVLAAAAIAFYVFVYTLGLKRRTPQNIVWGGAAGCFPVLIGWAAVTGSLGWAPIVLCAIVFTWTPPHYWPLSMRFKDDYAAAGVPMLPVLVETRIVARQIVLYTWATVAVSLLLVPVVPMGWVYSVGALVLGGIFIYQAQALLAQVTRQASDIKMMRLFHWSNTYLSLLFLFVAIDPFFG